MVLIQFTTFLEETKDSLWRRIYVTQDQKNLGILQSKKKKTFFLRRIKFLLKNISEYFKRGRFSKKDLIKKIENFKLFNRKLIFYLISKQSNFRKETFYRREIDFRFNLIKNRSLFEINIKGFLKKFSTKLLLFFNIFSFFQIYENNWKFKRLGNDFPKKKFQNILEPRNFFDFNTFSLHFLKLIVRVSNLKALKKINYLYKIIFYLKDLFLKINYLQKKVEHIKNIFLVNSILSEKENKIKNLLLKKNSSKIFLKFLENPFSNKKLRYILISKKKKDSNKFFQVILLLKRFEIFLLSFETFKKRKNFILFFRNSISSLSNSVLFTIQIEFLSQKINQEKGLCIFLTKLFFRITNLLKGNFFSISEQTQINLLGYTIFYLFRFCNFSQKKYFLIFLYRLKEHNSEYYLNLKFKTTCTKIFFNECHDSKGKNFFIDELNIRNFLLCFLCSEKHYLIPLKTTLDLMKNNFIKYLLYKFIELTSTFLKLYKELIFRIPFISLPSFSNNLSKNNFYISKFKTPHIFLRKIVNNKLNYCFNDRLIFFRFLNEIEQFQGKFLFFIFMVTQGFYFKFLISENKVYNLKNFKKKLEIKICLNFFIFLKNNLFDFCFDERVRKKYLILFWEDFGKELLFIIGPNRDLFKFNLIFRENAKNRVLKKDFSIMWRKIIYLNHFSRISKIFVLKKFILNKRKGKENFKYQINFDKFNPSILKTKDTKLIQTFTLFQYEIKNGLFSKISIYNYLFSKKGLYNTEGFYEHLVFWTKNLKNCFVHFSKKEKLKTKNRELNSDYFDNLSLKKIIVNLVEIFNTKEIKKILKVIRFTKNSKDIPVTFLLNNIISIIILMKNNFDEKLINSLCFLIMFHSYSINSKDKQNFQKSLLKILNIYEKSIKNFFLIFKKDISLVIKDCGVKFLSLFIMIKLKFIIERRIYFSRSNKKQPIIKNIFSLENLIHDFSEHFLLNSKCSLKKIRSGYFC
jgi:hypothetical protein